MVGEGKSSENEATPWLKNPPITEVICGFVFSPPEHPLDAMDYGVYWDSRKDEYPTHNLHPAVVEIPGLSFGPPLQRAWLISSCDLYVVQIQHDRLLANWRKRGDAEYPHFSDLHESGLCNKAIVEFERYRSWLKERVGFQVEPHLLELGKISILKKGTHYQDFGSLRKLLPVVQVLDKIKVTNPQHLYFQLIESPEVPSTRVQLTMDLEQVRIEIRHMFSPQEGIKSAFMNANARVNSVFFGIVSRKMLDVFGGCVNVA